MFREAFERAVRLISPRRDPVDLAKRAAIAIFFNNPNDVWYGCSFVSEAVAGFLREIGFKSAHTAYGYSSLHNRGFPYEHAWLVVEGVELDLKHWLLGWQNDLAPRKTTVFPTGLPVEPSDIALARKQIYCRRIDVRKTVRSLVASYRAGGLVRTSRPTRRELRTAARKKSFRRFAG